MLVVLALNEIGIEGRINVLTEWLLEELWWLEMVKTPLIVVLKW